MINDHYPFSNNILLIPIGLTLSVFKGDVKIFPAFVLHTALLIVAFRLNTAGHNLYFSYKENFNYAGFNVFKFEELKC